MAEEKEIVNKVANSGLITIDLEDFYPKEHVAEIDITDYLFEGIILKEKDFRKSLEEINWSEYAGKIIAVFCSEDAIIPKWAYMLVAMHAHPYTSRVYFGTREEVIQEAILLQIEKDINPKEYEGKRVVIKGCGDKEVSEKIYVEITNLLLPYVKTLMFGEPCSTVPVYKKK